MIPNARDKALLRALKALLDHGQTMHATLTDWSVALRSVGLGLGSVQIGKALARLRWLAPPGIEATSVRGARGRAWTVARLDLSNRDRVSEVEAAVAQARSAAEDIEAAITSLGSALAVLRREAKSIHALTAEFRRKYGEAG